MASDAPGPVEEAVLWEASDGVATITLNRPRQLNAMNREVMRLLNGYLRQFDDDPSLRVAVIAGNGRAFCAGADLKERAAGHTAATEEARGPGAGVANYLDAEAGATFATWSSNKPLIAAVQGHCLAAGFELALACDIRLASEDARFGLPEIKRGFFPGAGGPQRLSKVASQSLAMEMILSGDPIDAQRALAGGIVSRVLPAEDLLPRAHALAASIAANAPLALKAVKEVVTASDALPLPFALRFGSALRWMVEQTDDAREGPRAFVERRPPHYKGR